jgi:amino acid transporter
MPACSVPVFSPWLFLIVGVLFLTVVLTFAELASYYDKTGGPVLYATDAFGPLVGFSTGWLIYLARMTAFAANANVMAAYLGSLADVFATEPARIAIITVVTVGLTWANLLGVKDGVRTMGVFTFLKVVPLVLLVLLGLQHVSGATLIPGGNFHVEDLGPTTLLLIYAYVGTADLCLRRVRNHWRDRW